MSPEDFDRMYGEGMYDSVQALINELGPTTRRDEWWGTIAPYEIIVQWVLGGGRK